MPIRCIIVSEVFWKARLALKNTKESITWRKRFAANRTKYSRATFGECVTVSLAVWRPQFVTKVANSNKSKLILKFDYISDIFYFHSIKFMKKWKNHDALHCCSFFISPCISFYYISGIFWRSGSLILITLWRMWLPFASISENYSLD